MKILCVLSIARKSGRYPEMFSARPRSEEPGFVQGVVKRLNDSLLQLLIEIDENIPAAHEIEPRERRVSREIVLNEDAQIPNALVDSIAALDLREMTPASFVGEVAERAVRVGARSRRLDGLAADVRAEDLDGTRRVAEELHERDGQGVHLFSGGAPGHPDASGRRLGLRPHDDGKDVRLQELEDLRVAEERRDVNEGVLAEGQHLFGRAFEERQILRERVHPPQGHSPREAPLEGRRLVFAEIDPCGGLNELEDLVQRRDVANRRRLGAR